MAEQESVAIRSNAAMHLHKRAFRSPFWSQPEKTIRSILGSPFSDGTPGRTALKVSLTEV